jgi:AmmeMemoRadiSam system protein B
LTGERGVLPRLRALEVAAFQREGRGFVRLRDPLGVSPTARGPAGLVLGAAQWELARRLDGATELGEAARAASVDSNQARALLEQLGADLLLEDERTNAALDRAVDALRSAPVLAPRGPGIDYDADPLALRIAIAGRVADDWDLPASADIAGALAPASGLRSRGALFARTYAALRHHERSFARVLLLGSVAAPLDSALIPLDRPLATPLGALELDRAAVAMLPPARGHDLLAHATSLALERHALFLRLILPRLPVCAVLVPAAAELGTAPDTTLESVLAALRGIESLPGRTLLVVACDLAELAGESEPNQAPPKPASEQPGLIVTGGPRARLRAEDSSYVDALTSLDASALWERGRGSENALRRAGLPLAWITLRWMQERRSEPDGALVRGALLGYQQAAERTGLVSSASVVFH